MSARISRTSSNRLVISLSETATSQSTSASSAPLREESSDELALTRSITAELRSAFTDATIAQLAYDMGQTDRGDQAYARARHACASAEQSAQLVSPLLRDFIASHLDALQPVLDACSQGRSEFHPALRQPSLS